MRMVERQERAWGGVVRHIRLLIAFFPFVLAARVRFGVGCATFVT
jgi:hypothetical protein